MLKPVSQRLKGTLQHPNRTSALWNLHYSPDDKRLLAADYPEGVVQVWDTATGEQLTKIETGYGYRGSSEYVFLTPDWSKLFVSREKRKITRVEKDGKRMMCWDFAGDVRAWDLASGKLSETFQHQPPRNILAMQLSPDGSLFTTVDELPGVYEGRPPRTTSLWDVKTRQYRPLPGRLSVYGTFAPDSKTIAITADDGNGDTTAVKLFDTATAAEKLSIPIRAPLIRVDIAGFTLDGRLLVGTTQVFPAQDNRESWDSSLKLWDITSGQEVASFAAEEKSSGFARPTFSPDGRTLVATNWWGWKGTQSRVYLFDLPGRKLRMTIVLGEKALIREPAFSPNGRWLAVCTQVIPEEQRRRGELDAEALPQPRIHLVDVAAGAVRETIIAPQGIIGSLCFNPDGKTLATSGTGKVLLWDVSDTLRILAERHD